MGVMSMLPETPVSRLLVRHLRKVVLPAPLGPRMAVSWPDLTEPFRFEKMTWRCCCRLGAMATRELVDEPSSSPAASAAAVAAAAAGQVAMVCSWAPSTTTSWLANIDDDHDDSRRLMFCASLLRRFWGTL